MNTVDIFLTNSCNKTCTFCFVNEKLKAQQGSVLSKAGVDQIIHNLKRANIHRVALLGGEPTIYPELPYITQELRNNNIIFDIFSNGLFNQKNLDGLPLEGMSVSVHIPEDERTEKKIVDNLKYLHQRKIITVVRDVVTHGYDFARSARFIKEHREYIRGVKVKIAQPNLDRTNSYIQDISQIKGSLLSFLNIIDKMGLDITNCCFLPYCAFTQDELNFLNRINYLSNCHRVFYIDTDLSLKLCPYHHEPFGKLEDLGAVMARKHLIKVPIFDKCQSCEHFEKSECIPCFSYSNNKDNLARFRKVVLDNDGEILAHSILVEDTSQPDPELLKNLVITE